MTYCFVVPWQHQSVLLSIGVELVISANTISSLSIFRISWHENNYIRKKSEPAKYFPSQIYVERFLWCCKKSSKTLMRLCPRDVFRTQSNICNGAFLGRLTAKNCQLFWQQSSVVDVLLGCQYVFSINHQIPPPFHNNGILIYPRTMNVLCSHKIVEILKLLYH